MSSSKKPVPVGLKKWHQYTKEEREAIIAERRKRDGLPPGKKTYLYGPTKRAVTAMKPKQIEERLALITGCPRAEARYWFKAVCALLEHELAHERQFYFPGSILLYPYKLQNKRFYDYQTQTRQISPEWVKFRTKLDPDLKAKLRKKYPFKIDEDKISIDDLC